MDFNYFNILLVTPFMVLFFWVIVLIFLLIKNRKITLPKYFSDWTRIGFFSILFFNALSILALFYDANSEIIARDGDLLKSISKSIYDEGIHIKDLTPELKNENDTKIEYLIALDISKSLHELDRHLLEVDYRDWLNRYKRDLAEKVPGISDSYFRGRKVNSLELFKIKAAHYLLELKNIPNIEATIYTFDEDAKKLPIKGDNTIDNIIIHILNYYPPSSNTDKNTNFNKLFQVITDNLENQDSLNKRFKLIIFSDLIHDMKASLMNMAQGDELALKKEFEKDTEKLIKFIEDLSDSKILTNVVLLSDNISIDIQEFQVNLRDLFQEYSSKEFWHLTDLQSSDEYLNAHFISKRKIEFHYIHENSDSLITELRVNKNDKGQGYKIALSKQNNSNFPFRGLKYEILWEKDDSPYIPKNGSLSAGYLSSNGRFRVIDEIQKGCKLRLTYIGFPLTDNIPDLVLYNTSEKEMYNLKIAFTKKIDNVVAWGIFWLMRFIWLFLFLFFFFLIPYLIALMLKTFFSTSKEVFSLPAKNQLTLSFKERLNKTINILKSILKQKGLRPHTKQEINKVISNLEAISD